MELTVSNTDYKINFRSIDYITGELQFSFKVKASDLLVYLNKISFSQMSGFSVVK